ncbi:hypothetical protein, conserved [Angomonas deanei]|uniref:Reverse transcriptase domain-containing protein n=1 Tax=Angomonas deanei TaxID=59799 RepID=A0A7G2CTF1_9TRYP|nr:hypothetical protein, conserved [Angomonas deanei]
MDILRQMAIVLHAQGKDAEATELEEKMESIQGHPKTWPLHLKDVTLLNMENVLRMHGEHKHVQARLIEVQQFLAPQYFQNWETSRTIKRCGLSVEDLALAVEKGKFEVLPDAEFDRLPRGYHGVNVFFVPEMKGRRRLITEPLLNGVIAKESMPKLEYPSRLERRQALKPCRYMYQLDFDAFYDTIPLDNTDVRNKFIFQGKDCQWYRLKTLPTGARWSVALAQAVTDKIMDFPTDGVVVLTLIDNIMMAAQEGQEAAFLQAVRTAIKRIERANLLTTPTRETVMQMTDDEILAESCKNSMFLGEEYSWDAERNERVVRNSHKTVAKLYLSVEKCPYYTCRTFAGVIALIMFAYHTVNKNPARLYPLLKVYRAVYYAVSAGKDWDDAIPFLSPHIQECLHELSSELLDNEFAPIAKHNPVTYEDGDKDFIIFTDASGGGWGAIIADQRHPRAVFTTIRQRWNQELLYAGPPQTRLEPHVPEIFFKRYSAHAEPRAIIETILYLKSTDRLIPGLTYAFVTDHQAIVLAQRKTNGFGGVGRGSTLNKLYRLVYDLLATDDIKIFFYYVAGPENPADNASRNFGDMAAVESIQGATDVPSLRQTYCPLAKT